MMPTYVAVARQQLLLPLLFGSSCFCCCLGASAAPAEAKDVLFFAVDDLRPSLGLYGASEVKTPHLDALAQRSMVFERMYTAVSVCAPARTAILVGRRPDTTHNWAISSHEYWRDVLPQASSLPQYFLQHGYSTIGGGKVRGVRGQGGMWGVAWRI
jgi:iduronate 2-sulfatase|eukprot:SAG25_NODE_547_length_7025_cov_3.655357_6_plen_156_part_00